MPGQVVDYLPEEQLAEVKNLAEFAGILALDKWTGNANGRQAVFARKAARAPLPGGLHRLRILLSRRRMAFRGCAAARRLSIATMSTARVTGWESFEPWLTRLETMPAETVWAAANEVPPEWYGGDLVGNGSAGGEAARAAQPHPGAD